MDQNFSETHQWNLFLPGQKNGIWILPLHLDGDMTFWLVSKIRTSHTFVFFIKSYVS